MTLAPGPVQSSHLPHPEAWTLLVPPAKGGRSEGQLGGAGSVGLVAHKGRPWRPVGTPSHPPPCTVLPGACHPPRYDHTLSTPPAVSGGLSLRRLRARKGGGGAGRMQEPGLPCSSRQPLEAQISQGFQSWATEPGPDPSWALPVPAPLSQFLTLSLDCQHHHPPEPDQHPTYTLITRVLLRYPWRGPAGGTGRREGA